MKRGHRIARLAALAFLGLLAIGPASRAEDADPWPLACRLSCYGKFADAAWEHLSALGVRHVFAPVPEPDAEAAFRAKLAAHGLTPLVLGGKLDLSRLDPIADLEPQLAACERMGVHHLFLSPRHEGVERERAYARLREAGDAAKRHGVTLVLETHPDLGTNADVQLQTMRRVDHPNVRVNFDTGNISYYNPGADAVAELEKILPYVATIELKDHDRQPRSWFFPALGRGRTDLAGVVKLLRARGFRGPFTIEIEGIEGQTWDETQTREAVAASVAFLRNLGGFDLAAPPPHDPPDAPTLRAEAHDSGFAQAHDSYNGMGRGPDGRIYYVLSSDVIDVGAKMFCFDPATRQIEPLGDLTEACGEAGLKAIPQGKSHVPFAAHAGRLYFATHVGVYSIVDGMETMGVPPPGYRPYPGGHLLSYDIKTRKFEDLARAPGREGVLTMAMDGPRGRIFGLTWPTGIFFRYDLAHRDLKEFGPVCARGEAGHGPDYRTICRAIAVDAEAGAAYLTDSEGTIHCYQPASDEVERVRGDDLRKDYFGQYDPSSPGHMGYNWRQVAYCPADRMIYGVHGNSGYLFRFDPRAERVEVLDRITSDPSRRAGMFDQFSYGYLGFALGPDGRTLFYLTGGPVYVDGRRVAGKAKTAMGESKGVEDLHLVTYDILTGRRVDHGAIVLPDGARPAYVNSIAVGADGTVYALSRINREGTTRTDLISVSAEQTRGRIRAAQAD
jgi:sugar phosphate isomerase/epimerase